MCKEYEQLKRQYDVETGAMHKAMQQASQVRHITRYKAHISHAYIYYYASSLAESPDIGEWTVRDWS